MAAAEFLAAVTQAQGRGKIPLAAAVWLLDLGRAMEREVGGREPWPLRTAVSP